MLMEGEEQQALFHVDVGGGYPCAYYVQSPSTLSTCHSPSPPPPTATSYHLSRYSSSSSRASNNSSSFLHDNKAKMMIVCYDAQSQLKGGTSVPTPGGTTHHNGLAGASGRPRRRDEKGSGDDDDDDDHDINDDYGRRFSSKHDDDSADGWWSYLSFRTSSSCSWICLQISWRLMVSLAAALLVFCIATKPPPPILSVKMTGIRQFGLGEGVDASGVTTKILTCNCSMALTIDNKSKLFGLHIHPPLMDISFDHHPLAISHGQELQAPSHGSSKFQLNVGTRNKPMYGAGRAMEDMLETGEGLPLAIRVSLKSHFRVVWSLIEPKFHHQAHCLVFLNRGYDKIHRTQVFNSTCTVSS